MWISHARNREDALLRRALADVAVGFYVDVGAGDPQAASVTRTFHEAGWQGINLEPAPDWFERLERCRPRDLNLPALAAARALDLALAQAGAAEIHFLRVALDGRHAEVLRGVSLLRWRPWIVLIAAGTPGALRAADAACEELLVGKGYDPVFCDGLNRFYLAREQGARRAAFDDMPAAIDASVATDAEWAALREAARLRCAVRAMHEGGLELAGRLADLQRERDEARAVAAQAHERLAAVFASRSWRIGAPLRRLTGLVRRLTGRPHGDEAATPGARGSAGARVSASSQSLPQSQPRRQRQSQPPPSPLPSPPTPQSAPPLQQAADAASLPADAIAISTPKPRLAFVSPLPPAPSGVADYAVRLLPGLSRHYEVTLIVAEGQTPQPGLAARWPVRDAAWFDAHAQCFDRVLYQIGNSLFHAHMPGLLERHPGTVVLHDVVLSDLLHHLECHGDARGDRPGPLFLRELYRSQGFAALLADAREGRAATVRRHLASGGVLAAADGVIVHSACALRMLAAHYGSGLPVRVAALPRAPLAIADRERARAGARRRLGLPPGAFVVCSFGVLAPSKLAHRLLAAWQRSRTGADPDALLVFAGAADSRDYLDALRTQSEAGAMPAAVRFTGQLETGAYEDHLLAADLAVQLRAASRGESSGAMLDCLAAGLPLIANAHGAAAEFPRDAVLLLDDVFQDGDLADALDTLRADPDRRAALAARGLDHLRRLHSPEMLADICAEAIEVFAWSGPAWRARAGAALGAPTRRLLVDVTLVALHDLRSGIQRAVRAVLAQLLAHPPEGWRVEPVYQYGDGYRHAARFALGLVGAPAGLLEDLPIEAGPGDLFLGLDLVTDGVPRLRPVFEQWRARGVQIHFVVFDLLPVLHPQWFPPDAVTHYLDWLRTVTGVADRLVCISRAVRDELADWLDRCGASVTQRPALGWFHLGADLEASLPSQGLPEEAQALLAGITDVPAFLMVGTVEPRKGHAQALAAFELLWARGLDCRLLIVGRAGWMVDALAARLRAHPEAGRRLLWFEDSSDELLALLYARSSALLLASEGEGFGLPLIEAARHGLPIVARDLPVFREVAGDHAWWFSGIEPQALADALQRWLELGRKAVPQSAGMSWSSWADATQALLGQILPHQTPACRS